MSPVLELWKFNRLDRVMRDDRFDRLPSYFLDTYFNDNLYSGDREILMADLPILDRRMAPFVLPTVQGKPIFREQGESVRSLTPPYIKPKDAVRAVEARNPRISEIMLGRELTLQERFDLRATEISEYHVRAIKMREAHMAARAFIDGKVVINYEADQGTPFKEITVDFGRANNHTVVKNADYWSDISTLILDDIQTWSDRMADALGGGFPTRMYLGSEVAKHFRKNTQVLAELVAPEVRRGAEVNIKTGIVKTVNKAEPLVPLGTLGLIDVFVYRDQVEQANGDLVDLLNPKDVLLVAPGAEGVKAYGAIFNHKAYNGRAVTDIFPSMWEAHDPSAIFLMHESAPLPIPLYPNRTLKATVLP